MDKKLSTGIAGLDTLLSGGLPRGHIYMIRGEPGTGKTTMAVQFLAAGEAPGDNGLYLTLSQTKNELLQIASAYGLKFAHVDVCGAEDLFGGKASERQTVLKTGELELEELTNFLRERIQSNQPARIVMDSLIDLKLRCSSMLAFRRVVRDLMDIMIEAGATAVLIDNGPEFGDDSQVTALVHGLISLQRDLPGYGIAQRRLEINKLRAVQHDEGLHDFTIEPDGIRVFPRLESTPIEGEPSLKVISTGSEILDDLMGGGVELGTTCMVFGQSGAGKSTVASLMLSAAVDRGRKAAAFLFEEYPRAFVQRAAGVGLPINAAIKEKKLTLNNFNAGEILPGEFVHRVLEIVDRTRPEIIAIDSVNGYIRAAATKDHAFAQFNALLMALRSRDVVTILVAEQAGLLDEMVPEASLSVLADSIIVVRQYEFRSKIRRSIAVLKKRAGPHSTQMHELVICPDAVEIKAMAKDAHESLYRHAMLNARHAPGNLI